MRIDKKNVFLLAVAFLFATFIIRDFSYTSKVEKSYYGVLCTEKNQRLQELESGTVQMTGTLNSNRHGRRISDGIFDIGFGELMGQVRFMTRANSYDKKLKWYNALLTADTLEHEPVKIGEYSGSTLCFAKNLSAFGMLLEDGESRFYLIAAEEKEGLPGAETAVLESMRGG